MPELYVEAFFNFLVGCFWVKFTPLFESLAEALASLVVLDIKGYGRRLIRLMENLGLAS